MTAESLPTSSSPYEFIDRNVELSLQSERGVTSLRNVSRPLKEIENTLIDDTITLINIFDGKLTSSSRHILGGERTTEGPIDGALYLDKSARPIRQLVKGIGEAVSPGFHEPTPYFLNIDKRPWLNAMELNEKNGFNLEDVHPDEISIDKIDPAILQARLESMRAMFVADGYASQINENDLSNVWDLPTRLDGQTIAIIDEVKSSGNTLRIAKALLERAFPETNFEGIWWSDPGTISWDGGEDNDHKRQKATRYVPPWYSANIVAGRGVGDIYEPSSMKSPSRNQRIGRSILSTVERDNQGNYASHKSLSASVRRDLAKLAMRFNTGQLIDYMPSVENDDEAEEDRRIELYYKEPADVVYKKRLAARALGKK